MILVTGGTGLVGSHLLYQLTLKYNIIKATYRSNSDVEHVRSLFEYYSKISTKLFNKIKWVEADLNNLPQLKIAFEGVSHVYHCAAYISFDPSRNKKLRRINIKGTANIVNLCIINKIKKLCHVSSIATIGFDCEKINEENRWDGNKNKSEYSISKYGAEMEVWRGTQEGINSIVVNPGVIIGPGFSRSAYGVVYNMVKNKRRFHTKGKTGYIDVFDVVNSMIYLMNSKISNEKYILVNENLSYKKVNTIISNSMKIDNKSTYVSKFKLYLILFFDLLISKILRRERKLSKALCNTLTKNYNYSSDKIKKTMHEFEFTPIIESFEKSYQYYSQEKFSSK